MLFAVCLVADECGKMVHKFGGNFVRLNKSIIILGC